MSIRKEVGQATWDSWPVGARMAIERLERRLTEQRREAYEDMRDAAAEQRWADKADAEGVKHGSY